MANASIIDSIQSVSAGDIFTNIWNSGLWTKVLFWFELILGFGVVALIVAVVYKKVLPYNIKATIFQGIGESGYETRTYHAKEEVDDQGKRKLVFARLKKGKRPCTAPVPEAKYRCKSGRKDQYFFWMDDNKEFHPIEPMKVEAGHPLLKLRPQERDAWARFEDKQLIEKFKKKEAWEKWLPSAVMGGTLFAIVLIWFFLSKDLGAGLSQLADTFRQVASSCAAIG